MLRMREDLFALLRCLQLPCGSTWCAVRRACGTLLPWLVSHALVVAWYLWGRLPNLHATSCPDIAGSFMSAVVR